MQYPLLYWIGLYSSWVQYPCKNLHLPEKFTLTASAASATIIWYDWRFARIWRNVPPGNIVKGRIDQETADTEGGHKNIKKNRQAHVKVCPGSLGNKKYCRKLLSSYLKIYSSILRWWVDQRFIVCACKYSTNLNSILFCQNQRSLFVSCSDQTANISEDHWHLKVQAQYKANPFS